MSDKVIENNQVTIMGEVVSGFTFSHEVFGEGFYMVDVDVKRLSNSKDRIPVMVSERLVDVSQDYEGEYLMICGQFRSYNRHEEQKTDLYCPCSPEKLHLLKKSRMERGQTISCWTAISVNCRYTVKLRSEEKLQIFCLR